jgi:hypothetical protein
MRTDRLAIVCLAALHDDPLSEITAASYALRARHENLGLISPNKIMLAFVDVSSDYDSDFIPGKDKIETPVLGNEFASSNGSLGVYLVAHGVDGDIPLFGPKKFYGVMKKLNLLDNLTKIAIIACGLAGRNDFSGASETRKSYLFDLCKELGENNVAPKIAGWTDFITVVYDQMWEEGEGRLGKKVMATKRKQIDYLSKIGRRAAYSAKPGQTKGKLALMNSETKKEQKLYYVYREGGVIKLAREDWVDKPLAS